MIMMLNSLPVDQLLPEIRAILEKPGNLVVVADPGSGKTTRIPPACLGAPWLEGKRILMLEPRRIAARAAALFLSRQRSERVGTTIGYRVRGDSRVSNSTRLEVVTEGILTRMIQEDSSLESVGMIIFDEFHERSVHVDLALALALEVQRVLRPDLRLVVMSATIDARSVATLMGNASIIECPGRQFTVEARYLAQPVTRHLDLVVVDAIKRALREESGDILVFLPGRGEINRVAGKLPVDSSLDILPLHSEIRSDVQDRVLTPDGRKRRVILATNIAETSLTIPGVRIVIDSGLMRTPRFNPRRGIAGLETVTVSLASATQRAGRAGRQEPGVCYRLWTEREQSELTPFNLPEIMHADLASLLLELAAWGRIDIGTYSFLSVPPEAQLVQARELLTLLGAIDAHGKITAHGRAMLKLSIHPRLANMLLRAQLMDLTEEACDAIALLEQQSLPGDRDLDQILSNRLESLKQARAQGRLSGAFELVAKEAQRLKELCGAGGHSRTVEGASFGKLLALAYPERVAQQREPSGVRFLMRSGTGAVVAERSPLTKHPYLAIAHLDGSGSNARVFLAEPLTLVEIEDVFSEKIERRREVSWDEKSRSVRGREIRALGALSLEDRPVAVTDGEAIPILLRAIREMGIDALPLRIEQGDLRARIEWLRSRQIELDTLPDLSNGHLLATLEQWLPGFLTGVRKLSSLSDLSLDMMLAPLLPYELREKVKELAPAEVFLPSGRSVPIDYQGDQAPAISARLQELFGLRTTPRIARGDIPITISLLSPAGRPLQVTADLESFWKNSYNEVRKEMQGRYPRHSWPLDPLSAQPMRGTKKRELRT